MLILGLLLLLIFDTLIRDQRDSKLKLFWIKKFKTPWINKIDNIQKKVFSSVTEKLTEKKPDIRRSLSRSKINFLSIGDLIKMIPLKHSNKFFIFGLLMISTSLISFCMTLYKIILNIFTFFYS
jgi:hypothetical protein